MERQPADEQGADSKLLQRDDDDLYSDTSFSDTSDEGDERLCSGAELHYKMYKYLRKIENATTKTNVTDSQTAKVRHHVRRTVVRKQNGTDDKDSAVVEGPQYKYDLERLATDLAFSFVKALKIISAKFKQLDCD